MPETTAPLFVAEKISQSFPGVKALQDVDLRLRGGEIHALMGQNGAGKSTLIKILTGAQMPDSGTLRLAGKDIAPSSPQEAQQLGISTVYQEVNLCPNLSVAENIYAGRYPRRPWTRGGGIDWKQINARARELLESLNVHIDVRRPVDAYPVAVQQMVAIARALAVSAQVLILDEPTSSLDEDEVQELFNVMRRLRSQGMAILFVTHFLDQVYAVSDRITVLRNGRLVGDYAASELPQAALVSAMVGREFTVETQHKGLSEIEGQPVVLETQALSRRGAVKQVDLSIHRGEVMGLGGLLGSGRTELARLLFGMDRIEKGSLSIGGSKTRLGHPSDAVRHGLAMCPEERKTEGIVAELSVRENIVLALQARMGLRHYIPMSQQVEMAERFVKMLGIKTASIETPIGKLSGGNQQKVVLARWLATEPSLLILDEPTRGIDIAAKQDIMNEIVTLARKGLAVLFISAEIEELARICDRIAIMRERSKVGELPGDCGEEAVMDLIAGAA